MCERQARKSSICFQVSVAVSACGLCLLFPDYLAGIKIGQCSSLFDRSEWPATLMHTFCLPDVRLYSKIVSGRPDVFLLCIILYYDICISMQSSVY